MLDEKVVSTEEGQKLADEYGIEFWEASAKNDINVEQVRGGGVWGESGRET